jgi:hypothetical protein
VLDPKATIMGLQLAVLQAVPLFCLAGQASHSSVRFWFPSFANFASFCLKMSSLFTLCGLLFRDLVVGGRAVSHAPPKRKLA